MLFIILLADMARPA